MMNTQNLEYFANAIANIQKFSNASYFQVVAYVEELANMKFDDNELEEIYKIIQEM